MHTAPDSGQPVDVQALMREIKLVVRSQHRERDILVRAAGRTIPAHLPAALARLRASATSLEEAVSRLGEIPPGPPTVRAKAGAFGVRLAQRGLFWFLPALRSTQQNIVHALRDHVIATDELLKSLQRTNMELELLRRQVEENRPAESSMHGQSAADAPN